MSVLEIESTLYSDGRSVEVEWYHGGAAMIAIYEQGVIRGSVVMARKEVKALRRALKRALAAEVVR